MQRLPGLLPAPVKLTNQLHCLWRVPPCAPADLVRQMLDYRASERITAAEALRHPFFALQL